MAVCGTAHTALGIIQKKKKEKRKKKKACFTRLCQTKAVPYAVPCGITRHSEADSKNYSWYD